MSGGQENSSHPQKDQEDNPDIERRPDGGEYTEESDEEERQHPLKGKLMESFDEINRSTTKGQTSKIISFVVLILSEPSVKDPEEGFFLKISEYAEIVAILSKILKQNEVDPMVISSVFEKLKPIAIFDGSQNTWEIQLKVKILLDQITEHIIDVEEIGHVDILNEFYKVLNTYTLELKKGEISSILNDVDFNNKKLDKTSFKVHFEWFTTQILGHFYTLNDIQPLIQLLVTCLEESNTGSETLEDNTLRQEVMGLFKKTFEMFGQDQARRFIEVALLKDQKLYEIFFNVFCTQMWLEENSRPKTADPDFYTSGKNATHEENKSEDEDDNDSDDFPSNNYKLVESRPKTCIGFGTNESEQDRKDLNFDLSPSQSGANDCKYSLDKISGILTKSNAEMRTEEEKDSQKPLIQFLTDEKQFETLGSIRQSKDAESNLNHLEFNTISEAQPVSPRLSDLHPENIQKRYEHREKKVKLEPEVDEEVLKQKIEHERRLLNQEWEYKLDQTRFEHKQELKTLQQVNTQYKKDVDEAERLRSENEDMKKINDQLMEKYEKTLQDNIDRIKRDEEQKQVKPAEQVFCVLY